MAKKPLPSRYYNFVCLPDNLLVQTFETVTKYEVTGRVFVYIDGCLKPKSHWKLMPNDGYLYWHGYLDPSFPTWIDDIVVSEKHRRRGLGSLLVMKAEERIKSFGLHQVQGIATKEGASFWQSLNYAFDKQSSWFRKTLETGKKPLYPHVPKRREPLYPHTTNRQQETLDFNAWITQWARQYDVPPIPVQVDGLPEGEDGWYDWHNERIIVSQRTVQFALTNKAAVPVVKHIIAHEFGHYLTFRRVGVAKTDSCETVLSKLEDASINVEKEANVIAKHLTGLNPSDVMNLMDRLDMSSILCHFSRQRTSYNHLTKKIPAVHNINIPINGKSS